LSETDNNTQGQKAKISKLAVASLVAPVSLWGSAWFLVAIPVLIPSLSTMGIFNLLSIYLPLPMIFLSFLVGIALSISSLMLIGKSDGKMRGRRFAIEGIIVSVILFMSNWLLASVFFSNF
jgi:hypothetical protein